MSRDLFAEVGAILTEMGGPGSGHFRHAGRKGKRGGSTPSKAISRVPATRSAAGGLNDEWAANFSQSHGEVSGPFENVLGEDNPKYYTLREKDRLVAGATTTRTGMVTFIHSIASHSPGAGQRVLDGIKKDSIFIRTQAATEEGKRFFERNGFIYDLHPGYYSHRWTRRHEKSDFIIDQIESQLVLSLEGGWVEKGGPGSGHWRHAGRKGKRGGSTPSKASRGVDPKFAKSPTGQTLDALNDDYDFVVMGSAALRLHLGEDMDRLPKDLDVLDLSQKRADIDASRWVNLSDPRMSSATELQDIKTGIVVQHYESGQIMDTVRGIRAPMSYGNTEKVGKYDVLSLKKVLEVKVLAGRERDDDDVMNAILAKNLPRDYLGKNRDYWVLWELAHGVD